jgi:hypothetical protein
VKRIMHRFVHAVPETLEEDVLYVSLDFATVAHRCFCGCGREVITPLSPTDWKLSFDGESVSLYPSVGNWGLPCRSHYWIECDRVRWAPRWSDRQVRNARNRDRKARDEYFRSRSDDAQAVPSKGLDADSATPAADETDR